MLTPIIRSRTHNLNIEQGKAVENAIIAEWEKWINGAPPEYKVKGIVDNLPLVFTVLYGQDQKVDHVDNRDEEAKAWNDALDLPMIRTMTFALASTYGYVFLPFSSGVHSL